MQRDLSFNSLSLRDSRRRYLVTHVWCGFLLLLSLAFRAYGGEVPLAWCTANAFNCPSNPPYAGPTPADWDEASVLVAERFAAAHYNPGICPCDGTRCSTVTSWKFLTRGPVGGNRADGKTDLFALSTNNGQAWSRSGSNPLNGPSCGCPQNAVITAEGSCQCNAGYDWDGTQCVLQAQCTGFAAYLDLCRPASAIPPKNRGKACTGNPCNPGTGLKVQREVFYSNGLLKFEGVYNSSPVASPLPYQSNVMGKGWTFNYGSRVSSLSNQKMAVLRPSGQMLEFRPPSAGLIYLADADVADRLERLVNAQNATTGWRYTDASSDTVELYSVTGRLLSLTTRSGESITLTYSDASTPISITYKPDVVIGATDSFGRTIAFAYNQLGRIKQFTDPAGQVLLLNYDDPTTSIVIVGQPPTGNLSSVVFPAGTRVYHYNEQGYTANTNLPNALTGITDEANNRYAIFKYDSLGRVISSEHANSVDKYQFSYDVPYAQTTVVDPLGQSRVYNYSTVHGVVKPTGISTPCSVGCEVGLQQGYDANGNISSKTDFNGVQTTYIYDLARNLETFRTEALGTPRERTITTQWHPTYRLPTQIDEPGRRTVFTHYPNGDVQTQTVTDTALNTSRTWTYTYNGFGQVLTVNGPRTDISNDITTYTYHTCNTGYQCGQVHTITNALGHVTTFITYNAHGQPLTYTDQNSVLTTLTYDTRLRLTSRLVGTELTSFEYWPTGLLKKVTLPDLSFIEYGYDAAHRLTQVQDSAGNRIAYTLDPAGNRTNESVYDPSNALTQARTQVFNNLSQLYQTIASANTAAVTTTFGYDNNGNHTTTAAPLSRNSVNGYDELNRLTQVTDPANGITQYGYNALDQLISVTDPRVKTTTYTTNALGDVLTQVSPDTGTTTNTYDGHGNLKTATDARAITATYTYDALNRPTQIVYTGGQTKTFTYDQGVNGVGQLTSTTNSQGTVGIGLTYTPHGRLASKTHTVGSVSQTVSYGYNSQGQLATLTLPSGNTVQYGYANGKVTSLTLNGSTALVSNVSYQPFGPIKGWTWGNGTPALRTYDQDGRIASIVGADYKLYGYDAAGRINLLNTDFFTYQNYGYDALDRLTSGHGRAYAYDANGNRHTQSGGQASAFAVSPTNNRLTSAAGWIMRIYDYDNSGNVLSDGFRTFTYNDAGRMASATQNGVTTTYTYNAVGQRVRKTTGSTSRYFVYDEAGHLIGEYDTAGALIQEIVWLGDTPIATVRPNAGGVGVFYIHTDHLNTPRQLTRPTDNEIVWRWNSDAFGVGNALQDPDGNGQQVVFNLRFPGQYYDQETGLHYNYFRDYDPQTGRYVQSDPIGLRGGLNTYAYVKGNPVKYVDPLGLEGVGPWTFPAGPQRNRYNNAKKGCRSNDVQFNAGFGPEVSAFFLVLGGSASAVGMASTDGKVCSVVTVCGRLGLGGWIGGEMIAPLGATRGGAENAGGWDFGGGFDLGFGPAMGADVSVGNGSASAQVIPGIGGGWGLWGGFQACHSEVKCKPVFDSCGCEK